jgi:hypothetical protein
VSLRRPWRSCAARPRGVAGHLGAHGPPQSSWARPPDAAVRENPRRPSASSAARPPGHRRSAWPDPTQQPHVAGRPGARHPPQSSPTQPPDAAARLSPPRSPCRSAARPPSRRRSAQLLHAAPWPDAAAGLNPRRSSRSRATRSAGHRRSARSGSPASPHLAVRPGARHPSQSFPAQPPDAAARLSPPRSPCRSAARPPGHRRSARSDSTASPHLAVRPGARRPSRSSSAQQPDTGAQLNLRGASKPGAPRLPGRQRSACPNPTRAPADPAATGAKCRAPHAAGRSAPRRAVEPLSPEVACPGSGPRRAEVVGSRVGAAGRRWVGGRGNGVARPVGARDRRPRRRLGGRPPRSRVPGPIRRQRHSRAARPRCRAFAARCRGRVSAADPSFRRPEERSPRAGPRVRSAPRPAGSAGEEGRGCDALPCSMHPPFPRARATGPPKEPLRTVPFLRARHSTG